MHRRLFLSWVGTTGASLLGSQWRIANVSRARRMQTGNAQPTLRIGTLFVTNAPSRGLEMGFAEAQHAAELLRMNVALTAVQTSDDVDSVTRAAMKLLSDENIAAIIGGESVATCAALANVARNHDAVYMNAACSANELRETLCNRHAFHVAPSDRMKQDARGTGAAASVTAECLSWHDSLSRFGADTLNARFRTRFGQPMSERDWNDWVAVKILWETFARARVLRSEAWIQELERSTTRFDGHKGRPLSFRSWDHQLRQPLYLSSAGSDGSKTVTEVPVATSAGLTVVQTLDLLGGGAEYRTCRWSAGS